MMTRSLLENHLAKECPYVVVNCPYFDLGCDFEGKRCDLQKHLSENTTKHLKGIKSGIVALNKQDTAHHHTLATDPDDNDNDELTELQLVILFFIF